MLPGRALLARVDGARRGDAQTENIHGRGRPAMPSLSYRAGRLWAKLSTFQRIGVFVALAIGAWLLVLRHDLQEKQRQADQQRAQAAAAAQLRERQVLAEQQRAQVKAKCQADAPALIAASRAALRRGELDEAAAGMRPCEEPMRDDQAWRVASAAVTEAVDKRDRRNRALFEASERARKKREGVSIGMSAEDVLASSWGRPEKVNRTTTAMGTREQWVYDSGYLYFTNGRLTAVQN